MATVEKEKEQKQDALNQSGCCGGVSKAAQQNEETAESAALKVKVEKKEGEQRSCCG